MKKMTFSVYEIIIALCFILGGAVGCVVANNTQTSALSSSVMSYLDGFSVGYNGLYLFFTNFLNILKYPLVILIFSFTVFGVAVVPFCVGVRGYALAFSITSFLKVLGLSGYRIAFLVIGIQSFLTLPCFILLSITAIRICTYILRVNFLHIRTSKAYTASDLIPSLITFFIVTVFISCVAAVFDSFVVPSILQGI